MYGLDKQYHPYSRRNRCSGFLIALEGLFFFGFNTPGFIGLLLSTLFTYLSYKAVKNTIKAFSSENNNGDTKESSYKYK